MESKKKKKRIRSRITRLQKMKAPKTRHAHKIFQNYNFLFQNKLKDIKQIT